jgi:hypothetical protein
MRLETSFVRRCGTKLHKARSKGRNVYTVQGNLGLRRNQGFVRRRLPVPSAFITHRPPSPGWVLV